jgi:hypothetical protein
MDSKSIGLWPQGFESPRCRIATFTQYFWEYALGDDGGDDFDDDEGGGDDNDDNGNNVCIVCFV